jgi:hypothetical protein
MMPVEWVAKYRGLAQKVRDERVLYFAATSTMADMTERIWGKGELTDGSTLKYDEDYEVYIYKPPFPRKPSGKGKTGKKIKGQWAPTYLSAKASQDRGDLPFELTGDLRIDWAGGTVPAPNEASPTLCLISVSDKNAEKIKGLTAKKGEFLKLNAEEIRQHARYIADVYRERVLNRP